MSFTTPRLPAFAAFLCAGFLLFASLPAHAQLFFTPGASNIRSYNPPGNVIMPIAIWGDHNGDGVMEPFVSGLIDRGDNSILISRAYRGALVAIDPGAPFEYDLVVGATNLKAYWLGGGAFGDLDRDGDLDLVLAGAAATTAPYQPELVTYVNDGGLPTWTAIEYGEGFYNGDLALGDLDNDGDLDLIVAGFDNQAVPFTRILENDGTGLFTPGQELTGVAYSALALADYDGDFDLDLAVSGMDANGMMRSLLYRNDDGTLVDTQAGLPGVAFGSADWGDYDGDGDPDLLLMGATGFSAVLLEGEAVLLRNDGGTLTRVAAPGLDGIFYGGASWQDLDRDGDLDIAATGGLQAISGRITYVGLNQGDGSFVKQSIVASNLGAPGTFTVPGLMFSTLAWGDYDSNGFLDLLAQGHTTSGEGYSALIAGHAVPPPPQPQLPPNVRPTPPTNLGVTVQGGVATLGWNASLDPDTPQPLLTYNVRVGTASQRDDVVPSMSVNSVREEVHELRTISAPGNAGQNLGWKLNLPAGTYFWSVQACDTRYYCSPFSTEATFSVP